MKLKSRTEIESEVLGQGRVSPVTLRYRLWQAYAHVAPAAGNLNTPVHEDISKAMQAIESIQAWHPTWLSYYIDYDKDIYIACTNQSKRVIEAMQLHQQNQNAESGQNYRDALEDLSALSAVAAEVRLGNYYSRFLMGASAALMLGLYMAFPATIMTAIVSALFIIPVIVLIAISLCLTGGFDIWYAPGMFSWLNLAVTGVMGIGLIGLMMNIMEPSPQGSTKLAQALNNLASACETHCPVPNEVDEVPQNG